MEINDLKYFLAANSCQGFVSSFNNCYDAERGWKAYIIKGGPGTGKSSFMKFVAKSALEKEIKVVNGADSIAEELRRIGNNINQIARGVNSGYITAVNLTETRKELIEIWQSLNSLVRDAQ